MQKLYEVEFQVSRNNIKANVRLCQCKLPLVSNNIGFIYVGFIDSSWNYITVLKPT